MNALIPESHWKLRRSPGRRWEPAAAQAAAQLETEALRRKPKSMATVQAEELEEGTPYVIKRTPIIDKDDQQA